MHIFHDESVVQFDEHQKNSWIVNTFSDKFF